MAAIDIHEKFQVKASAAIVWQFLIDPRAVSACLPGAQLDELIDERTFNGLMKVKVGPITTSYKGKVVMTSVDEAAHTVQMSAEGREGSGGSVRGSMTSHLAELGDGVTEVTVESNAEITGRIAQFGRGLIQEVSRQLFLQFVECSSQKLEALASAARPAPDPPTTQAAPAAAPSASASEATPVAPPPPPPAPPDAAPSAPPPAAQPAAQPVAPPPAKPVSMLPVLAKSIWAIVTRAVMSPFRRGK